MKLDDKVSYLHQLTRLRYDLGVIQDKALDPARQALNQLIESQIKEIKDHAS